MTVDVAGDGSGTVEVAVGLDADAVGRLPDLDDDGLSTVTDLAALVRSDDLVAGGWDVTDPTAGDGDMTWIRATKPFGTPDEADRILAELAGPGGALRDVHVSREPAFGRTSYGFSGTIDLSGGLEAFGDEGLAAALDGEVLGQDTAAIEQELGQPLADVFTFEISALLPGVVDGNGNTTAPTGGSASTGDSASTGGSASTWSPRLGDRSLAMEAGSTVYDWPVLGLAALTVVSAVALVGLLGVRRVRRRPRRRTDPRTDPRTSSASAETN
ncbi:MAG: hypothetical protein ACRDZN_10895 [Acidimicrobiales bacterium]